MKSLRAITVPAILLAIATLFSSASHAAPPPKYFVDEAQLPFTAQPGATAYFGIHAGAGYRVEVPDNWNGKLVVWAHGFRGNGLALTVDDHPLRQLLIPLGYAWAASSYTRNDYDITSGVQSTHALIKFFNGLVGKPSQILMSGASMGGHITGVIIEQYPNLFEGALPICGALGDYALFDYFTDFGLAAQQLGTGSSTFPVDPGVYVTSTVPAIKSNLELFPGGWPNVLNADGNNFKSLVELRSGGERPNFDEAWFFWNTFPDFETGPGNFLFDLGLGDGTLPRAPGVGVNNAGTVYQFDTDPDLTTEEEALNMFIFRVAADPQTRRKQGLAQVPTITGDIDIPVVTLHNLGDLFVPVLNQVEYVNRVNSNGKGDLLVQRAIRGVSHCGFTGAEFSQAFIDLVTWVDFGVKPAGDDFSDPAAVADPAFGCQFTDFITPDGHLLATPCP